MWVPWSWFLGCISNTEHACPPIEWALNPMVLGFPHNIHATGAFLHISCHAGHYYSSLIDHWIRLLMTPLFLAVCIAASSTMKTSLKRGNFQFSSNWIFPCPVSQVCCIFSKRILLWSSGVIALPTIAIAIAGIVLEGLWDHTDQELIPKTSHQANAN